METETVALLPVLRRLEVMMVAKGFLKGFFLPTDFLEYSLGSKRFLNGFQVVVGGSGAAASLAGLRLLQEHLSHTQVFVAKPVTL